MPHGSQSQVSPRNKWYLDQFVESLVERVGGAYQVVERMSELVVTAIAIVGKKAQEKESCAKRTQLRDVMLSFDKNLTKGLSAVGKLKLVLKNLMEQINGVNLLCHIQGILQSVEFQVVWFFSAGLSESRFSYLC